jgi:hypothetical protein
MSKHRVSRDCVKAHEKAAHRRRQPTKQRIARPLPPSRLECVSPVERVSGCRGTQFDVYDGKGQIACNANGVYLSLVRSMHPRYKSAEKPSEKRMIAAAIYDSIVGEGGRFFDANGNIKSESGSKKKIMKSLKDMKTKPNSADTFDSSRARQPSARSVEAPPRKQVSVSASQFLSPCPTPPVINGNAGGVFGDASFPATARPSEPHSNWNNERELEWICVLLNGGNDGVVFCKATTQIERWSAV